MQDKIMTEVWYRDGIPSCTNMSPYLQFKLRTVGRTQRSPSMPMWHLTIVANDSGCNKTLLVLPCTLSCSYSGGALGDYVDSPFA